MKGLRNVPTGQLFQLRPEAMQGLLTALQDEWPNSMQPVTRSHRNHFAQRRARAKKFEGVGWISGFPLILILIFLYEF